LRSGHSAPRLRRARHANTTASCRWRCKSCGRSMPRSWRGRRSRRGATWQRRWSLLWPPDSSANNTTFVQDAVIPG
jgi:hypothetical protein